MSAAQGTAEWQSARIGCVTASRFSDVMKKGRSKSDVWGGVATTYALQVACERLTGQAPPEFSNAATDWGNEHEVEAVVAYQEMQAIEVDPSPFVTHALFDWVGGSPDGLVGRHGLIEVKCPHVSVNHLRTVWNGCMPDEHKAQVQGNLWVTGRDWCDFVSFDPRLPASCSLFITRVDRDADYIEKLANRVELFGEFVNEILEACRGDQ